MRTLDIIKRANSNLLRSKTRTILTILAIFIGAFTLTLTIAIGQGAEQFVTNQTSTLKVSNTFIVEKPLDTGNSPVGAPAKYNPNTQTKNPFSSYLTSSDLIKIEKTKGILSVQPGYELNPEYITTKGSSKYVITASAYIPNLAFQLEAGALPSITDSGYVILPAAYVSVLGFANPNEAIGKTVEFVYANLAGKTISKTDTIKGVLVNSLFSSGSATINNSEAKEIYAFQNSNTPLSSAYRFVYASYAPNTTDAQVSNLKNVLKKESYTAQTFADAIAQIQSTISIVEVVLSFFAFIAILASTFGITNTLIMSIYERKQEIGLMKALGMSRLELFKIFAIEATSIGFWGGLVGSGVAILIGETINHILSQTVLKDFFNYQLLIFTPLFVALVIFFLMLIGFLAGTIPALRASKLDPITALREE